ncbi:hypothetical protein OPU71_13765 [Niveibacterium sp. 24ML]|uniref:hypothetical protein n=1 Tax=Niveibacterium sp. 24ML TaxID=2985512 RepID=UPI002272021C|nr:hypothetical protein [Niveibacterium sp. 24ML]MCX9157193.1 hypothetical protein [Niveibacterium sp. 24ML]
MRTLKTRGSRGGQGEREPVAIRSESAGNPPGQTPSHRVEIDRFIELCVDGLLAELRAGVGGRPQTKTEKEEEK